MISGANIAGPTQATPGAGRIVYLAAAAAVLSIVVSWGWPSVHDAPLMHYVAQRIRSGDAPYRDLFDMNFPGTYLVHLFVGMLPFGIDASCRILDTLILAASVMGVFSCMRPCDDVSKVSAASFFVLLVMSGGPNQALQRDLLMTPLELGAVALLMSHLEGRSGLGRPLGAGLLFGAAFTIKPFAALVPAAVLTAMLLMSVLSGGGHGRRVRDVGIVLAGAAVVPALAAAWLVSLGAWDAFIDILRGYLLPIYSTTGRLAGESRIGSMIRFLKQNIEQSHVFILFLLLGMASILTQWSGRDRAGTIRFRLASAAFLGAAAQYFLQQKGWSYHVLPMAAFGGSLVFWNFQSAIQSHSAGSRAAAWGIWLILLGPPCGLAMGRIALGKAAYDVAKQERVNEMVAALKPRLRSTDTVQVFDTTGGAIHALYLLRAAQPTRFIYDFPLLAHDPALPYIQKLRAEALTALTSKPPAYLILVEQGWPSGDYHRLERFPELSRWVEEHYRIMKEGDAYRILEHRETPDRPS